MHRSGTCSPTSGVGWLVQFGIGAAAALVLATKWTFERPQRHIVVFLIDCSKQIVGGGVIHFVKVVFSTVLKGASAQVDDCHDASCLWYLVQSVLQPICIIPICALLLHVGKIVAKRHSEADQWGHYLIPYVVFILSSCCPMSFPRAHVTQRPDCFSHYACSNIFN